MNNKTRFDHRIQSAITALQDVQRLRSDTLTKDYHLRRLLNMVIHEIAEAHDSLDEDRK